MQRSQRGAISGTLITVILIAIVFAIGAMTLVSYFNYGNRTEQHISAKYKDNENIYAQGTQAVMEIAQVPAMYAADLKALITADIQGRYGKDGSQATFQWLKERNLTLDASMYKAIQNQILAFRGKFENSQRELLDTCRSYKTALGAFPGNIALGIVGYPKINLAEHCEIVTTDKARQTFETKRDSGIQLRPAN